MAAHLYHAISPNQAAVLFKHGGSWYVAVSRPGKLRKFLEVRRLMHKNPVPCGWLSKLRRAAVSALQSA